MLGCNPPPDIADPICSLLLNAETTVLNIHNSKLNPQVSLSAKHISIHPLHCKKISKPIQPENHQKHAAASKVFDRFDALQPVYEDKTLFVNIRKIDKLFSSKLRRKGVNHQTIIKNRYFEHTSNRNHMVTVRWMLGAQLLPDNRASRKCVGSVPARKDFAKHGTSGPRPFRLSNADETIPGF